MIVPAKAHASGMVGGEKFALEPCYRESRRARLRQLAPRPKPEPR
jgi:hypothetical protein